MDRRTFLKSSAKFTGVTVANFAALQSLSLLRPRLAHARFLAGPGEGGYGPLQAAGLRLALPPGFQYRRFSVTGSLLSDGFPTPPAHDGMAAFPLPNGNVRLIRNHEIGRRPENAPQAPPAYDSVAGGGTTSLEIDAASREVVRDFVSLSGTVRNCAGGPTPWGSWLTCEEAFVGPATPSPDVTADPPEQHHGYIFEVPVLAESPVDPVPLEAMGRFVHEAIAVDAATGVVYETEDALRAGFYRFLPNRPYTTDEAGDLTAGGRLQMLAIDNLPQHDCNTGQQVGRALPVVWVDIDNPDPTGEEDRSSSVFEQGWLEGGARFSRVEGAWAGEGAIYFSCTNGGDASEGQIWRYRPIDHDRGELTLIFESPSAEILNAPDNICVSPRGGIVICEDGSFRQFIRGLTPDGKLFDFAENLDSDSEFAGATYSPDGQTLFVNIQGEPGATFAIWGPWERGVL